MIYYKPKAQTPGTELRVKGLPPPFSLYCFVSRWSFGLWYSYSHRVESRDRERVMSLWLRLNQR